MAVIGIDLGTTNSLGAVYQEHKVILIPNRFGNYLTPSVVSLSEDGSVLVGEIAKQRLVTHPKLTVSSFKKDMGTDKKYQLGERFFLPEELSSFVIASIVEDARNYLQEEIEEVVISVPAYFHDKQRVATKRAGALAGVTVKRIINEPSAAAMASYFDSSEEQTFLVFDFGGGTLDVSVVECFDTMVEILSVSGDNRLGGDNFHDIMADKFMEEHGIMRSRISEKEYAVLLRQAEVCKRRLTTEETAVMSAVIGNETYQSEYTNQRLMEECGSIFARMKKVLIQSLRDGGLNPQDIDAVIMVGGSSKMPLIQSYVQHLFRMKPLVVGNCDEMIVRGLGLVCAVKNREEEIKDYVLTDICPFTLGTDAINRTDPEHSYMIPIVERNTVLPCSRVKRFYTSHDNQKKIDVCILQGEHPYAEDNIILAKMSIPVPKKKEGEEAVDIRFTYDINGILIVDMTVVSTRKTVSKIISQNMSESELEKKAAELAKLKVHPKDVSDNRLMMERLKCLYEEAPLYLREQIQNFIRTFEMLLERQDLRQIKKYRVFLEGIIEQIELDDPFRENFCFEEFDEDDEEFEEDDEEDDWMNESFDEEGNKKWTS